MLELWHVNKFIGDKFVTAVFFTYAEAVNHKFLPINFVSIYRVKKQTPCLVSAVEPINIDKVKIGEQNRFY